MGKMLAASCLGEPPLQGALRYKVPFMNHDKYKHQNCCLTSTGSLKFMSTVFYSHALVSVAVNNEVGCLNVLLLSSLTHLPGVSVEVLTELQYFCFLSFVYYFV